MPKNDTVFIPAKTWTKVNDADISNITMQNRETGEIFYTATASGAAAPTTTYGALRLGAHEQVINTPLISLFPGVAIPAEIWVYASEPRNLFVSHG